MAVEPTRIEVTPKDPLFIIGRKSNDKILEILDLNYTYLSLGDDWELCYVKPEVYETFLKTSTNDFIVGYSKSFENLAGYIDSEWRTISRDKASRFYAKPTAAHFFGLMLGWSMVGDDWEEYDGNWTPLDRNVWHGDVDSVLLNIVMPKDGTGACGCGDNHSAVLSVGSVLETKSRHPFITEERRTELLKEIIYPDTPLAHALLFINYVVDAAGLTEHGGSVYHGWLNTKGIFFAFLVAQSIKETAEINAE